VSEITASGNIRRIKRDLGRHRAPGTGDHAAADALELLLVLPLAPAHSLGLLVCMAAWSATVAIAAAASDPHGRRRAPAAPVSARLQLR